MVLALSGTKNLQPMLKGWTGYKMHYHIGGERLFVRY